MPHFLDTSSPDFAQAFDAFLDAKREEDARVDTAAAEIIEAVRARGDAALLDYTARFDRLDLTADSLRISGCRDRCRDCAGPG